MGLSIGEYDSTEDKIRIEGQWFSGKFFRKLGCLYPLSLGEIVLIDSQKDGFITLVTTRETIVPANNGQAKNPNKGE